MGIIAHIVRKEFRQIRRDPLMLRVLFVVPMVQLFVLGYAITFDIRNVALVIRDADRSRTSRLLVDKVEASRRFRIAGHEDDQAALEGWLRRGEAALALSIPAGFERELLDGKQPALQVLVDGVDSNSSTVALGYLQRIIATLDPRLPRSALARLAAPGDRYRIEARPRVWFNPELESKYYMLPGIVAILLTVTTTLLTGLAIVKEQEIGTLEQLNVTPIRSWQLILGKTIPFLILSFILLLPALAVVTFWHGIPMAGSLPLLLAFSFVFLISTLGVGLMISTIASTQQEAVLIAFAFNFFAILMSGMFAPIHNMPPLVRELTYLNPVRYFVSIIRGIYLKGSGFEYLWRDGLALLSWGVVTVSFAVLRFKKRID